MLNLAIQNILGGKLPRSLSTVKLFTLTCRKHPNTRRTGTELSRFLTYRIWLHWPDLNEQNKDIDNHSSSCQAEVHRLDPWTREACSNVDNATFSLGKSNVLHSIDLPVKYWWMIGRLPWFLSKSNAEQIGTLLTQKTQKKINARPQRREDAKSQS